MITKLAHGGNRCCEIKTVSWIEELMQFGVSLTPGPKGELPNATGVSYARAGQNIGLLGGSFDPAHAGHLHITQEAMKRFGLGSVWWLVSPGNPLKAKGPAPLPKRLSRARKVADHPKIQVTDIECRLGTRYTAKTIAALIDHYPGVRFTWLMGADNLVQFDQWQEWRWIMQTVRVGVLARPGDRISARTSKTAKVFASSKLRSQQSHHLASSAAPKWCFVNIPMMPHSSSAIRAAGAWPKAG